MTARQRCSTTRRFTFVVGVISPVEHIAILIGPYLDLGVGGKFKVDRDVGKDDSYNATLTSFGLLVHAAGYY